MRWRVKSSFSLQNRTPPRTDAGRILPSRVPPCPSACLRAASRPTSRRFSSRLKDAQVRDSGCSFTVGV
eukprot:1925620-Pyramimonas_sp.AAC.1